ncbi:MAG: pilus assembly protein N-terminal domain-containing protein [Proteobacteria bacterium]|nr:pilus assembly protein N-terminal domain-containing protein [Pseudomonadota bacterium]
MRLSNLRSAALGLLAVFSAAGPASADGVFVAASEAKRVALAGWASDVVVGDPNVADVALVGPQTLVVIGKKTGVTSLMVFDRAQRVIFQGPVSVGVSGGHVAMVRGSEGGSPAQERVFTCVGVCSPTSER